MNRYFFTAFGEAGAERLPASSKRCLLGRIGKAAQNPPFGRARPFEAGRVRSVTTGCGDRTMGYMKVKSIGGISSYKGELVRYKQI